MAKRKGGIFERVEGTIVNEAKDYIEFKKQKLIRFGEFSIMMLLSLILITIGIALLIGYYFPTLDNGFNFLILGVIFFLVGYVMKL